MKLNFKQNVNSNQNETDKINSISENPTEIKVCFDFYRVSDVPHRKLRVCLCTCISEKNLGCAYLTRCAK